MLLYKSFPKRQSYVKNSNAAKFFCPNPNKNYNFVHFISEDYNLDIKIGDSGVGFHWIDQ